jgi:hypothetical protein
MPITTVMHAVRRVLASDLDQLSERDRTGLALAFLVGSAALGLTAGALILAGVIALPAWLGVCGLVGGALTGLNAGVFVKLARKRS